jgi:hypothetical protein
MITRTRWFKRPWFLATAIIAAGGLVAFALSDSVRFVAGGIVVSCIYGLTSGDDVDKAAALEKAVTNKTTTIHRFVQNSATRSGMPPISVNPGSRAILTQPPLVTMYEIKDRAVQDKVIAAVQAVMRDQKLKRVDLQFMDHENWIVYGNMGERGPELQLRQVRISQNGIREEGGTKTITYPVP